MHTHHCLQGVETVFRGVFLVVDVGLRNDVILLMTAHQVDVLFAVVVDRGLQAQLLIDSLIKGLAEVGHLLDELDQFFQLQTEEHGRCDGTNADC